jgi:hypothetical protein
MVVYWQGSSKGEFRYDLSARHADKSLCNSVGATPTLRQPPCDERSRKIKGLAALYTVHAGKSS